MQSYESRKPAYFATPAVQLVYALHASLRQILSASPMDQRFAAHFEASRAFKRQVRGLGLRQIPESDDAAANGMTTLYVPQGVVVGQLIGEMAKRGVQVAGGLHTEIAQLYIRIGWVPFFFFFFF